MTRTSWTRRQVVVVMLMAAVLLGDPIMVASQETPASIATAVTAAPVAVAGETPPAARPTEPGAEKESLAEQLSAWWAFPIGLIGSAAYLVAVWVGMVGRGGDARDRLLAFFNPWSWLKVPLYLASGGGVALVFQLPEKNLVPIQAFIIGCTWPAVVANYLSGRQTGVPPEAEREAANVREQLVELQKLKSAREALPQSHLPADADMELEALLNALKRHDG